MDILLIKVSDGQLITIMKINQNYSSVTDMVTSTILKYHPGKTAMAYALCDAIELQAQVVAGKILNVGNGAGGGSFDVIQKSAVVGETIIPPFGILESTLEGTDDVVVYV